MSEEKNPTWIRAVQIALGILAIILSMYALVFPGLTYLTVFWILTIVLFFVGIERIIVGIVSPGRSRWTNIGLGILVLIFGGIAIAYPVATAYTLIIFIGIAFLFGGCARIIDGFTGTRSGGSRAFLIGVGILAVILSIAVLVSPLFGAVLAGIIIGVGLLITGIQMVVAGVQGTRLHILGRDMGP